MHRCLGGRLGAWVRALGWLGVWPHVWVHGFWGAYFHGRGSPGPLPLSLPRLVRLVCLQMKTPMSLEILDNWSLAEAPRHPLTVPLLLQREAALGREVGLIIDLANHDCL